MTLHEQLGVTSDDEILELVQKLASPPVVVTIVRSATGEVTISGVGNSTFGEVKALLVDALQTVMAQEILRKEKALQDT